VDGLKVSEKKGDGWNRIRESRFYRNLLAAIHSKTHKAERVQGQYLNPLMLVLAIS
jgi:hypothetical protein